MEWMKIEISTSGRSISPKIASFGNLFAFSSHLFLHKYIGDICSKSDTWGLLQLPLPVNWGDSILPSSPGPQLSNRDPKLPCFWTIFSTTLSSLWGLVWTFFINPDFRTRPFQLWCENIVLSEEAALGVNCQVRGGSEGASEPGAGPRWKQGASGLNIKDPLRQQTGPACSQDQHRYTCEWLQRHFEEDLAWNQTVSNLWWQAWNVLHMIWNNSILSSVFKSVTVVVEICSPKSRISCPAVVPRRKSYIVNVSCVGQKDPCGILGKPRAEADWNFRLNVVAHLVLDVSSLAHFVLEGKRLTYGPVTRRTSAGCVVGKGVDDV